MPALCMKWPGGRRLTHLERERIIAVFFDKGKAAANAIAVGEYLLSPDYVYKLLNARGLLPRGLEEGGRHCLKNPRTVY